MKINRAFIKGTNWALAGLLSLLGFTGCIKSEMEYGTPQADYTVKGTVDDKATGKPIEGIRVAYSPVVQFETLYGILPTPYQTKKAVDTTDVNGSFQITENTFPDSNLTTTVFVDDIDGEQNGLYQSDTLQADFYYAKQTKKSNGWYKGEFTVTEDVQLDEIKNQ
jgi:putative lipoprotein (rSAM/lipoprotein system)